MQSTITQTDSTIWDRYVEFKNAVTTGNDVHLQSFFTHAQRSMNKLIIEK